MVALAFEERGIDVVSVGNGEAAVRRIPDLNPDLVLADVFMPVRNGYEVCEFVKKDERFSHIPVILLVGAFDPLDEKEARRVGADGVLKKPFVPPDPLIAMVTSALEKNPKVAAEMAKAREAAAAPPPEPIAPVLEAPARMEPKPLPEFPEPTPEEAAQIYGFGKGLRTIGDDDEPEEERKAPKALGKKREKEKEKEEDEDDDGAALTAHDWRRTAADFEVPDEPGGKLAFASDEDFNPITFPSERDVPPKHVRASDEEEDLEPAPQKAAQVEAPAELETPILPKPAEPEPVVVAQSLMIQERAPEPVTEPEPEPMPTAAAKSKIGGWMDMMTSPSEYSEGGGWLSGIFGHRSDKSQKHENAAPAEPITAAKSPEVTQAGSQSTSFENAAIEKADQAEPFNVVATQEQNEEQAPSDPGPAPESWLAPPPPPVLREASEPAPPSALSASSDSGYDLIASPPDVTGARRDPELEEPPPAHVVPEPLLIKDDENTEPSRFGRNDEQPSPLHSFFAPASDNPMANDPMVEGDPARHEEFDSSIFAPRETESLPVESSERIPTAPPPNREALADIPFLMPPPPSPLESADDNHRAKNQASVDAAVARVLEKLEPQLHQLLSQSLLKPLVENLLQQELEKKEK